MTGVHDSFWTHACDIDKMNQILREKFVELYSMPILENVSIFSFLKGLLCINDSPFVPIYATMLHLYIIYATFGPKLRKKVKLWCIPSFSQIFLYIIYPNNTLFLWFAFTLISKQLLESFQTTYPGLEFPPLPKRGNFDLNEVLNSPYFFN